MPQGVAQRTEWLRSLSDDDRRCTLKEVREAIREAFLHREDAKKRPDLRTRYLKELEAPFSGDSTVASDGLVVVSPFGLVPRADHWLAEHSVSSGRLSVERTWITIDGPDDQWRWTVRSIVYAHMGLTL